ncbi:Uma2 family endonuclease [Candidatus Gracilibacteria bacterium]|nr:Uma2 family endonuclease [Candidatus Gracilibacteria bacterium]
MAIDVAAPLLRMVWPNEMTELDLEPLQGLWTEAQYLRLTNQTNHLIEFTDGVIEVLPMPTDSHQAISRWLFLALLAFVQRLGGTVYYAPLRIEVRPGKFREPDLLLLLDSNDPRRQEAYWLGADLVVEIVSPDKPKRDTEEKPLDYAEAQIPEYWIVNPLDETITVLTLDSDAYATHGLFARGETATSRLLDGFAIDVNAVFDAQGASAVY